MCLLLVIHLVLLNANEPNSNSFNCSRCASVGAVSTSISCSALKSSLPSASNTNQLQVSLTTVSGWQHTSRKYQSTNMKRRPANSGAVDLPRTSARYKSCSSGITVFSSIKNNRVSCCTTDSGEVEQIISLGSIGPSWGSRDFPL